MCYVVNSKGNTQEATMKSTARLRVGVFLVLIVVALASSLWAVWRTGDWEGLALNFGTEMAGAVVTYLLLELVIGRTERREAKKADLIAQMGSKAQDVAIAASEQLARCGWLYDGSLQGADLEWANLQEAFLPGANLQGADLLGANLQEAFLHRANLQGAFLYGANLQGTDLASANLKEVDLEDANLQGANLLGANLQGAFLRGGNLQGAHLGGANLQGVKLFNANLQGADLFNANLQGADFDENTTLPDGTNWTPNTDIARFTDPKHPDFWRPDAQ
jgi:hypothetical protein